MEPDFNQIYNTILRAYERGDLPASADIEYLANREFERVKQIIKEDRLKRNIK